MLQPHILTNLSIANWFSSLPFSIPDREARCSSWGYEPSFEEEFMIGIIEKLKH